jgi:hypothetical protein
MGAVLFTRLAFPRLLGPKAIVIFALFVVAISAWAWSGVLLTTKPVPLHEMLEYYFAILERNAFMYAPIYLAVAIVDGLPLRGRWRIALLVAAPVIGALLAVQVRCLAMPDQLVYVYGSMKLPYCDAFPTWRSYVDFPNSWIAPLTTAGLVMAFVFALRRDAELVGALNAASAAQLEARRQFVESEIEAVRSRVDPDRLRETLRGIRDRYQTAPVEAESLLDELIARLRMAAGRPAPAPGAGE